MRSIKALILSLVGGLALSASSVQVLAAGSTTQGTIEFVGPRDAASLIARHGGFVHQDKVYVKLRDDVLARVQAQGDAAALLPIPADAPGGNLRAIDPATLASLQAMGTWQRGHHINDNELEAERQLAMTNAGVALPDLRQEAFVRLRDGITLAQALDTLNAMADAVEIALPHPLPAPSTLPPNYRPIQRYLNASPTGIAVSEVASWAGARGTDIRVCDVEYSWNAAHIDLPPFTRLGPVPVDPFGDNNHGTAVLGQLVSRDNGWGTTGAVPDAVPFVAAANTASGYNVGAAITASSNGLRPGDVILIEQQTFGPNGGNYVPVEWVLSSYNAIRQAVLAGRHVVEAAGNGGENLDGPLYNTGHRPFLLINDSGAIMVGAGAAPAAQGGSTTDRSRLWFSCYGATLDLQGWGERVVTTGYGDLFNSEGINARYTQDFGGTSSASPIVTSAVASLQGMYKLANDGQLLSPLAMRDVLRATGAAQQSGQFPASQNIGPRPDVLAAAWQVFGSTDCNTNQRPDMLDIAGGSSSDSNNNNVPDECEQPSCDSIDMNNDGGLFDPTDIDAFLSVFSEGPCIPATAICNDIDFNNDGGTFDPCDIDSFLTLFSEGPCTNCGV